MQRIGEVVIGKQVLVVALTQYAAGPLAVVLLTALGDPWATLSVNLEASKWLPEGHFYAKTWSENESMREPLLASGLFEDTGERMPTGFVEAERWRLCSKVNSAEQIRPV